MTSLASAFGPIGRMYAPYVLLRTLREWRKNPIVRLPTDIRRILEATYAQLPDEPTFWAELRGRLEQRKKRLLNLAVANMNVRGQPLLEDEEGVQTRYCDYTTIPLLLVCKCKALDCRPGKQYDELTLYFGTGPMVGAF